MNNMPTLWDHDYSQEVSWRRFSEAKKFAHALCLMSQQEWRQYTNVQIQELPPLPSDIPHNPDQIYSFNGWKGWADWLGLERISWAHQLCNRKFVPPLSKCKKTLLTA